MLGKGGGQIPRCPECAAVIRMHASREWPGQCDSLVLQPDQDALGRGTKDHANHSNLMCPMHFVTSALGCLMCNAHFITGFGCGAYHFALLSALCFKKKGTFNHTDAASTV
jgi:hypothetical protein